ncbi:unnamed protein product [Pseudo-nitzschia multistriata]|uniref:Uncharacterized protein n=1 Tax=Pseudo-nitzschia multistriata TaxID=183589 RepID=A0A448ZML9_9STRA|nr:unnamed protein product [Pseudo-nitzschia multistriata]
MQAKISFSLELPDVLKRFNISTTSPMLCSDPRFELKEVIVSHNESNRHAELGIFVSVEQRSHCIRRGRQKTCNVNNVNKCCNSHLGVVSNSAPPCFETCSCDSIWRYSIKPS